MGCHASKQSLPSLSSSTNGDDSVASQSARDATLGATPINDISNASSSSNSDFSSDEGVKFSRLVGQQLSAGHDNMFSTAVSISSDSSSSSTISSVDPSSKGFDLIIQHNNTIASFQSIVDAGESVVEDWLAAAEENTTMTSASASVMNSTLSSAPRGGPARTRPPYFCLSPSVQISKRDGDGELEVKDTNEVSRGHVRVPKNSVATKGSWLTNR